MIKKYAKGARLERAVVQMWKKQGYISCRTAGSHSPIDVFSINPKNMQIVLVQCKNKVMSEKEIAREIAKLNACGIHTIWREDNFCVQVFLAHKVNGEKEFKLTLA